MKIFEFSGISDVYIQYILKWFYFISLKHMHGRFFTTEVGYYLCLHLFTYARITAFTKNYAGYLSRFQVSVFSYKC